MDSVPYHPTLLSNKPMPTRGCRLYLGLLALGAYSCLPARCGALDRGPIDGTFALQVQQQEGEGHENVPSPFAPRLAAEGYYIYSVEVSFVMTGFDFSSLSADSAAMALFNETVTREVCKSFTG